MILAQYVGLTPDVTETGMPLSHESKPSLVDEEHPHIMAMLNRRDLIEVPREPTQKELRAQAKALEIEGYTTMDNNALKAAIAEKRDNTDKEGDG